MREWGNYQEYLAYLEETKQNKINTDLNEMIAWADSHRISQQIIPRETEELRCLKNLSFSRSPFHIFARKSDYLNDIPEYIQHLVYLENLNISGNKLTALPKSIRYLSHIDSLNMSRNHLSELPEWISCFKNLVYLDISLNRIKKIPEWIGSLEYLHYLKISHKIRLGFSSKTLLDEKLPYSMLNLENLHTLIISTSIRAKNSDLLKKMQAKNPQLTIKTSASWF